MQLRPQIANHQLSTENSRSINHNLDVSLFERLCSADISPSHHDVRFPVTQLTVQRRMRPEMADLVRFTLYKELLDYDSVRHYESVAGMYQNLYWFDHSNYEDQADSLEMETSHSNMFEVQMVVQLVSHLYKQGCYKAGDLAIITPYLGQLRKLRNALRNTFAVQMSERDENDLAELESNIEEDNVLRMERKPLTESVRIATVRNHSTSNTIRWITSKEKKPRS